MRVGWKVFSRAASRVLCWVAPWAAEWDYERAEKWVAETVCWTAASKAARKVSLRAGSWDERRVGETVECWAVLSGVMKAGWWAH